MGDALWISLHLQKSPHRIQVYEMGLHESLKKLWKTWKVCRKKPQPQHCIVGLCSICCFNILSRTNFCTEMKQFLGSSKKCVCSVEHVIGCFWTNLNWIVRGKENKEQMQQMESFKLSIKRKKKKKKLMDLTSFISLSKRFLERFN